jgi:hypothetical protein
MSQDMRTVPVDVQVAEHAMRAEADAIAEYLRALSYEVVRLRDNPMALRLRLEVAGLAEKFAPELARHHQAHQRLQQALHSPWAEGDPLALPVVPTAIPGRDGGTAGAQPVNRALLLTDYDRRGAER